MSVFSEVSLEKIRFLVMAEKNGNSAACTGNSAGVGFLHQFQSDKNENHTACFHTCLVTHIRISAKTVHIRLNKQEESKVFKIRP